MRASLLALPVLFLLTACAGQLRDFVGPVSNITSPQMLRFGLNIAQARCVGENMGQSLRPRQLRAFVHAAAALQHGSAPGPLGFRDLTWVANQMGDGAVPPALHRADLACGVTQSIDYAQHLSGAAPDAAAAAAGDTGRTTRLEDGRTVRILGPGQLPVPGGAASPGASGGIGPAGAEAPVWLNLGAAAGGQAIAVNAATLIQNDTHRTAWFRLTDPGATPSPDTFLLDVDCAHRTINARARERHDAGGAIIQHVDYPSNPLVVEGGTVMEIAWLSLCT